MKKKMAALVLAGAFVLAGSISVFAEAATEGEISERTNGELQWSDYKDVIKEKEELAGKLTKIGDTGLKMYVPDNFESREITDTLADEGFVSYFMLDEDHGVGIQLLSMESFTLDEYKEELENDEELTLLDTTIINGQDAVVYKIPNEKAEITVVSLEGADEYLVSFLFVPTDEEAFAEIAEVMEASIQAAD